MSAPALHGCRPARSRSTHHTRARRSGDEQRQAFAAPEEGEQLRARPELFADAIVRQAGALTLDNQSLQRRGASLGAGLIAALPAGRCGLAETARVVRYLALESAGQCGPCLNGLPRIAEALAELAGPRPGRQVRADVERWATAISGRGACAHPDGSVRFVRSALAVFAAELGQHADGRCTATTGEPFLPLPEPGPDQQGSRR